MQCGSSLEDSFVISQQDVVLQLEQLFGVAISNFLKIRGAHWKFVQKASSLQICTKWLINGK
jgi:hypothetical protein